MPTLSAAEAPTALRQGGVVGERLRNAKATVVADALGKSDSWVDKVRNGESGVLIHDIPALLEALGLKCVGAAMNVVCDREGRPICKLHGLRMLNPEVFSRLPLASADSTNIAQNIGIDSAWRGPYTPASKDSRALVMRTRIESQQAMILWDRTMEQGSLPWSEGFAA